MQLIENLQVNNLDMSLPTGMSFVFRCEYFVTDWLDYDIDDYFLKQDEFAAKIKLLLFKQIVAGVEAIHTNHVFHRDLKPDNMRADVENIDDKTIFVIDFGTSAQYGSEKLRDKYVNVGMGAYSAPETFLGFAGERDIAKFTDVFALGCMLYELFNDSYYFEELFKHGKYESMLSLLGMQLGSCKDMKERVAAYINNIGKFSQMVEPPKIMSDSCTLPKSITSIIEPLFLGMIDFNFKKRLYNFYLIRNRIDIAMKVLENEAKQKKISEQRKAKKAAQLVIIQQKDEKLKTYLSKKMSLLC